MSPFRSINLLCLCVCLYVCLCVLLILISVDLLGQKKAINECPAYDFFISVENRVSITLFYEVHGGERGKMGKDDDCERVN